MALFVGIGQPGVDETISLSTPVRGGAMVLPLRFGRFLNFSTTVLNSESVPSNFTERGVAGLSMPRVKKARPETDARQRFGANVRAAREARGLSQQDLAQKARLHRCRIDSVEAGTRSVDIDNLERLSDALGLEPADLLLGLAAANLVGYAKRHIPR